MSRWTRTNLLLAALAGVLAMLAWSPATETPGDDRLTGLMPNDIRSIRVERGNRLVLALQRDSGGWRLTHPRAAPASDRRVGQLLAVAVASVAQRIALDDDGGRFGLADPAAILQLDQVRLAFGDRDPTQRSRYVRVGNEVCIVDDLYFNLLTLPAGHFTGG